MTPSQRPGGATPLLPSPFPLSPSCPTHSPSSTSPLPPKSPSPRARVPSTRSGEDKGFASTLTTRPGSPMMEKKGTMDAEDGGKHDNVADDSDVADDGDVVGDTKGDQGKEKNDGGQATPIKGKAVSSTSEREPSAIKPSRGTTLPSSLSPSSISKVNFPKDGQEYGRQASKRGNDEDDEVAASPQLPSRHPIHPVLQPQAQRSPVAPTSSSSPNTKNGPASRSMELTEEFGGVSVNAGKPRATGEMATASVRGALILPTSTANSIVMRKTKSQEGLAKATAVVEQEGKPLLAESLIGKDYTLKGKESTNPNKSRADSASSAKARIRSSNLHSTPTTSAHYSSHSSSGPAPSSGAYIPPASGNLRPGDTITFPDNPNLHGCPYCDKVYEGQHARSICRRHQMSKHGIELEVQVKKSRWDNNPNRPATEAEKHKRTLESKRRWAAKDRRRRRAQKLGLPFDELDDDDEDYSDEEYDEIKRESDSPALHYGSGREARGQSESFDESKLQAFSPRSEDEVSEEEEEEELPPALVVHGTPVSQLRSSGGRVRNTPARYRQDSEDEPDRSVKGKAMRSDVSRRKQPAQASRRLTRAGSTTSSASSYPAVNRIRADSQAESDSTGYQSQSMQPEEGQERSVSYGWASAQVAVPTALAEYYIDDQGRRKPSEARAVRNKDGTISYLYPTTTKMSHHGYSSAHGDDLHSDASSGRTRPDTSSRTTAKSNGRPASRRQGSLSIIQLPIKDNDDNVFGSGSHAVPDDEEEDLEAPITPSKKRTQISRRESSDSDEEAAKVLLAISASPARLPTDVTPAAGHVAADGPSISLFLSPSRVLVGEDSARTVQFKEVPGAAALTEDDSTPVRPYNGVSRGAHGRKAGESALAGGLWPAQVRRKSISERHIQSEFDDPFHPPGLQSSSAYHPSSSASRRALDSEPQTPGELDPPVEIMQYDRADTIALYGRQRDPFAHPSDRPDALLSSPLSYSSKPGPATSLVQTSSMRSSTGLSTLSSARLTTPARPGYGTIMAPPTTDRRDLTSPAISGSYLLSSPNGLDLTHKLGLAPTALAPDSPGWLAMVRDTPIVRRGMKRRRNGGSSDASGDGEGDDDDPPMLTGREAKRTRV